MSDTQSTENKKICFFSSDARPLYKRDVFRALSYPDNFVIHFRYNPKYIQGNYLEMIGKAGLIFLSSGNDLSKNENERNIQNFCVREVSVTHAEKASDTELIHFYLKLGSFKFHKIDKSKVDEDSLPGKRFVSELEINPLTTQEWYQIIDNIKISFPNELFYKFKINTDNGKEVKIGYDHIDKQSYYKMNDEDNYNLEISFYDTEESKSDEYHSLRIKSMNEQMLSVSSPDLIKVEARKDNRVFSVFTKSISSSSSYIYLHFESIKESANTQNQTAQIPQVDTVLKIKIEKSKWRITSFAFWSIIAAISLGWAKIISDNIKLDGVFSWGLTSQLIGAGILGFFSAFFLYKFFDKK